MAVAMMLPAMAQQFGNKKQLEGATQPAATFQSTSAMQGSGSTYSATPMLNADGTAAYGQTEETNASKVPGRQLRKEGTGTPGNTGTELPIGDAVLPLLLMACAYLAFRVARRRREALTR